MARIKPKRHGVVTDMTAMCDVAFLLLTFFILTTQFKKSDVEQIQPPSSISETILPDTNIMTVNSNKDGKFFFQPVENRAEKKQLLEAMGTKYGIQFTEDEKEAFAKTPSIGVPISKLKGYLALSEEEQKNVQLDGVPMDSTNRQLIDWIEQGLLINGKYKLAIKGDINTSYPKVKNLFEGLRDIDLLVFMLVTTQEKN